MTEYTPHTPSAEAAPHTHASPHGPQQHKKHRRESFRSALTTILIVASAPLFALLLIHFVFQSYEVDGPSMEQTLQNRDRLIVNKLPRTMARLTGNPYVPVRGDIIVFHLNSEADQPGGSGERQLIKRVVGVPGDRVVVSDGQVVIYNSENPNGFNPDTSGLYPAVSGVTPGEVSIDVGEGEVFVLGDNRVNSLDSRSFGTVQSQNIVGDLAFRIFPLSSVRQF